MWVSKICLDMIYYWICSELFSSIFLYIHSQFCYYIVHKMVLRKSIEFHLSSKIDFKWYYCKKANAQPFESKFQIKMRALRFEELNLLCGLALSLWLALVVSLAIVARNVYVWMSFTVRKKSRACKFKKWVWLSTNIWCEHDIRSVLLIPAEIWTEFPYV